MRKYVNIKWSDDVDLLTRSMVEQLVNSWEDFAYGYDMEDEALDDIVIALQEIGIDCEIAEEEDEFI